MTHDTDRRTYRALDMLLDEHAPLLRRRSPYWAPQPAKCWRDVHTPAWSWDHPSLEEAGGPDALDLTYIDAVASYVSASSSASYAHGALEHTGAVHGEGRHPGYYLIDNHIWQDQRIVSPLGMAELGDRVWIAYPTLEILQRLARDGFWPEVRIHDSWTCTDTCRFRSWATAVNNARIEALRDHQDALISGTETEQAETWDWYENGVKHGYAQAFQMMLGPGEKGAKSKLRRPDWYHTTLAQASANTWRATWKCVVAGYQPVRMGSVDEVAWYTPDFRIIAAPPNALLKMDNSGYQLGHFKVKPRGEQA